MTTNLGGVYRFAFRAVDGAGNPVVPPALTVTVVKPNGTAAAPITPTDDGGGNFHADYTTADIGRHVISAAGTGFATGPDVFHVRSTVGAIIGLADAKNQIRESKTLDDETIRDYLNAAAYVIQNRAGRVVRQSFTEVHDGGFRAVFLKKTPVLSVTQVSMDAVVVAASEYTIKSHGMLRRKFGIWSPGVDNVSALFVAGMEIIPDNYILANRLLLQHWWATQRQGANMPGLNRDEVLTIPGVAWSVPIRVAQLIDDVPDRPVLYA